MTMIVPIIISKMTSIKEQMTVPIKMPMLLPIKIQMIEARIIQIIMQILI